MAGPEFEVTFEGLDGLLRALEHRPDDIVRAAKSALFIEGEETITEAKRLTPVDEGVLRASGHVQLPEETADGGVEVRAGFGGPAGSGNQGGETNEKDVGYAVYVHEDLTARHPVGQAKYLEVPVNQRRAGFVERVVQHIRERLEVV